MVSLAGLILQVIATGAVLALSVGTNSRGLMELAWLMSAGILIWFISLLVFRQHELAALEALDLEELRREKQSSGGGEALFGEEGGGGLAFQVAKARLEWMQNRLAPAFGLIIGAYLLVIGVWRWFEFGGRSLSAVEWGDLKHAQIGLILLSLVMLLQYFFARYASGMSRIEGMQLLRAGGSYMLACAIVCMAQVVCFGVYLYQQVATWEHVVAYATPVLMGLLGVEALASFVLDRYRPRIPGVEHRASFDSRLLAMISEPGGIAHSVAEAINYQFGFRVSQTWFYTLLQRTLVPLLGVGAAVLWLLSSIVVVWPHERVIIERFGRQVDAGGLGPGIHFKWPAPFERAQRYNVDQLRQFFVGFKVGDQPLITEDDLRHDDPTIELWTDEKHSGRDHFDFLIPPTPGSGRLAAEAPATREADAPAIQLDAGVGEARDQRAPVHMVRLEVFVQYKIDPQRLAEYSQSLAEPDEALRALAWEEVSRFVASHDIDALMGDWMQRGGEEIRDRISRRAAEAKLGIEIVHAGIAKVHPEKTVAEAFRRVVTAQMQKVAEVRKARVSESETLAQVAGDRERALDLAHAIRSVGQSERMLTDAQAVLRRLSAAEPAVESYLPGEVRAAIVARIEAEWARDQAAGRLSAIETDMELGLGRTSRQREEAAERLAQAEQAYHEALAAQSAALEGVRVELAGRHGEPAAAALLDLAIADVNQEFWNSRLERALPLLDGEAAVVLARARASRWEREMRAAREVTRVINERGAYAAAPQVYKARRYLEVLTNGIKDARKYFLAFQPGDRKVRVSLEAQEEARPELTDIPLRESR